MPLSLLEYRVFRQSCQIFTQNEIDAPQVPNNQTWRVGHISVAMYYPPGLATSSSENPFIAVFDVAEPGGLVVPCQVTELFPLVVNGTIANTNFAGGSTGSGVLNSFFDADDDADITLLPGNQLSVLFFSPTLNTAQTTAVGAVRAEYAVYQGVAGQAAPVAGAQ